MSSIEPGHFDANFAAAQRHSRLTALVFTVLALALGLGVIAAAGSVGLARAERAYQEGQV